ncbi:hypothetical protein Tco_1253766 [Tanacetum coccineum]
MEDGIFFNQSKYIKEMLKKFGLEDSKPTKKPMSTEIKLTKDDEADSVDNSKYRGEIMPQLNQKDYQRTKAYLPRIHRSKVMNEEVRESYRHLESRLFHEGRFITLSFIKAKKCMILSRKNITIPRTTQTQLKRDPNKLHINDISLELRGWELFFREIFFCTLGNRDYVNACTTYMLYYLTIKIKFNFTSMILYRMAELKNKSNGPMPFAMLLTRLYNHILRTNPQAIVLPNRFTFYDHVMNHLEISRNPIKEKGKRVASPLVSSSSSSSSDGNEAPSFLEFYEELSDNEDQTDAQKEKRGIFKCLNRYFWIITKYLKNQK